MNRISGMEKLPASKEQGILKVLQIPLKITILEGSFLHIGGSPSPLTEKKAPVFSVDGKPAIPASSFKGAFRYQVEQLLIAKKNELKSKLDITDEELIKPCIPSTGPTIAEKTLIGQYREQLRAGRRSEIRSEGCWIEVEEERIGIPPKGLCPVCYLFGATGLMGFLRIPNFWPEVGEYRIDQTSIRIDRKSGTAATGAIVTGEQVKPGTIFKGTLEIVAQQGTFQFGRARDIGGIKVDLWLDGIASKSAEETQLLLISEILIPALNNIAVLGGQKSKGAGKVVIGIEK
jgi:CRISPR/Cas system CSM-associated protein Csm3 (group 7 of RAMP superfamily)